MDIILELVSGETERSERELRRRERREEESLSERLGECWRSLVEIWVFCFSITFVTV